jgi:hypothetical protein
MAFQLSADTRSTAGVLLLTIVFIEYGGWFMLRVVRGSQPATAFQKAFLRAGVAATAQPSAPPVGGAPR